MNFNQFTIALFPGLPTIQFLITSLQYANVDGGKAWDMGISWLHLSVKGRCRCVESTSRHDYSSLQGQVVCIAHAEWAMKHSLTHLRSYVDCIASIFVNCSSTAGQKTLFWHDRRPCSDMTMLDFNVLVELFLSFLYTRLLFIFLQ